MKALDVEKIRFQFGDSWTVAEKWDDTRTFLGRIRRLSGELRDEKTGGVSSLGTKAVDIVGVRNDDLYLIEVKDFRGHAIETKRRQPHDLPLLIGARSAIPSRAWSAPGAPTWIRRSRRARTSCSLASVGST